MRREGLAAFGLLWLLATGCEDDDAQRGPTPASKAHQPVVVSTANGCTVEWTKINYDTAGVDADFTEFIELRITRDATSTATTLSDCGLASVVLLDGQTCGAYQTVSVGDLQLED